MMKPRIGRPKSSGSGARASGFSLLEIIIALPLLALMCLAVVSGMVFASRTARVVSNEIAAKNIAQSYFERMAIDAYENVTPANYPDVTISSSPPLYIDHVRGTRCEVDITMTGYGTGETGTADSLTDNDASWQPGEWVGNTVFLVGGTGRGQRAQILANTANTLTVEPMTPTTAFDPIPDSTTEYAINGGKTVRITTRWTYLGKPYEATIESLVIDWNPRR